MDKYCSCSCPIISDKNVKTYFTIPYLTWKYNDRISSKGPNARYVNKINVNRNLLNIQKKEAQNNNE